MVEELPRPGLAPVLPQLPELLLEDIGRVEALVRGQECLESAPLVWREILPMREQHVLLALDVRPIRCDW